MKLRFVKNIDQKEGEMEMRKIQKIVSVVLMLTCFAVASPYKAEAAYTKFSGSVDMTSSIQLT